MKDRIPLYPGRVKLVPVAGQTDTFTMERADSPTEVGTPLSKATFMQDATATAFGMTESNTPNDMMYRLSEAALASPTTTSITVLNSFPKAFFSMEFFPDPVFIPGTNIGLLVTSAATTGNLYAGLMITTNGGTTWTFQEPAPLSPYKRVNYVGVVNNRFVLGMIDPSGSSNVLDLFYSTNGTSWFKTTKPSGSFNTSDYNTFIGYANGLYIMVWPYMNSYYCSTTPDMFAAIPVWTNKIGPNEDNTGRIDTIRDVWWVPTDNTYAFICFPKKGTAGGYAVRVLYSADFAAYSWIGSPTFAGNSSSTSYSLGLISYYVDTTNWYIYVTTPVRYAGGTYATYTGTIHKMRLSKNNTTIESKEYGYSGKDATQDLFSVFLELTSAGILTLWPATAPKPYKCTYTMSSATVTKNLSIYPPEGLDFLRKNTDGTYFGYAYPYIYKGSSYTALKPFTSVSTTYLGFKNVKKTTTYQVQPVAGVFQAPLSGGAVTINLAFAPSRVLVSVDGRSAAGDSSDKSRMWLATPGLTTLPISITATGFLFDPTRLTFDPGLMWITYVAFR